LFEEFAAHRKEARGEEETGWLLLGERKAHEAVVLATLPAGARREASVSHVLFNSMAQALGSRIVRQAQRRLTMFGVVHTHPGTLRHPSDGDFQGDSQWVRNLRGGEGVFAIGTTEHRKQDGSLFAEQPRPNVLMLEDLCLTWYALRAGEESYRPLPVALTIGPDLAKPLHAVWPILEAHAERLERLFCQQTGVTFAVLEDPDDPALAVQVPLADSDRAIRVVLTEKQVLYYTLQDGQMFAVECLEKRVDRGVYLLLAELAAQG
jgi:proteasome lid subunit RPN8/RPN11